METLKREQTAMWTVEVLQSISIQAMWNAWRYRNFGWIPEEKKEI